MEGGRYVMRCSVRVQVRRGLCVGVCLCVCVWEWNIHGHLECVMNVNGDTWEYWEVEERDGWRKAEKVRNGQRHKYFHPPPCLSLNPSPTSSQTPPLSLASPPSLIFIPPLPLPLPHLPDSVLVTFFPSLSIRGSYHLRRCVLFHVAGIKSVCVCSACMCAIWVWWNVPPLYVIIHWSDRHTHTCLNAWNSALGERNRIEHAHRGLCISPLSFLFHFSPSSSYIFSSHAYLLCVAA